MKIEYNKMILDSEEELNFVFYLEELTHHGFIYRWIRNTKSVEVAVTFSGFFVEKTKRGSKTVTKHLLRNLSYTHDFDIVWLPKAEGVFFIRTGGEYTKEQIKNCPFVVTNDERVSHIETKGTFIIGNSAVTFPIIQKVLAHYRQIYIQKIVPKELFKATFLPEKLRFKKNGALRVEATRTKSLQQYLQL